MYRRSRGMPVLGGHLKDNGVNFGILAEGVERLKLTIYRTYSSLEPLVEVEIETRDEKEEDIFCVFVENIQQGMAYEWRVWDKITWSKPLVDPYAYCIKEFPKGTNQYRNIVVKVETYKGVKPNIDWKETIIYELHVGAFTKGSLSEVKFPGTFKGLSEKLKYIKELGVTTIEILPIFKWNKYALNHKNPITGEVMKDVWGYNPINFFALQEEYSASKDPLEIIREFKELVEKAHELGLEIILDVVYNHTGEGGEGGEIFNFKLLAKERYYKLNTEKQYFNCSGTGNTLNTAEARVKEMIMESLRYWVQYMGVDGFRFDLASILGQDEQGQWSKESVLEDIAKDEILGKVKLITESWDAKGCYDVGKMPYPFVEWSDIFRDTMRRFIRGDIGQIEAVQRGLLGEEVLFQEESKNWLNTIHFITAHDGFTLWDLVSYKEKHNEGNGEKNRDGTSANYSYNWGIEGESNNTQIELMRVRSVKNFLTMLFVSKGVPMILMGDEMGRTQRGNNNAYCQDNEIVWVDWGRAKRFAEVRAFIKQLIIFRKELIALQEKEGYEISWHGVNYQKPDLSYYSRSLAYYIKTKDKGYYIIMNSYIEQLSFELPTVKGKWFNRISTVEEKNKAEYIIENQVIVEAFSIDILEHRH